MIVLFDDKLCSDPLLHYPVQSKGGRVDLNAIQKDYIWARTSGGQDQAGKTIPGRLLIASKNPGATSEGVVGRTMGDSKQHGESIVDRQEG